jgi:hypothetical protein
MFVQQVLHMYLLIPLCHSTRSFQFMNTCEEHDRVFVLLPLKMLHNLSPTSIDIHCKSIVDNYKA